LTEQPTTTRYRINGFSIYRYPRRFKVLPLRSPFNREKDFWEECVREEDRIAPVFNRDGYYWDRLRGLTWLEIGGEAWWYMSPTQFRFDLQHSDGNNRIHDRAFRAIKVLMEEGLADRRLREVFSVERVMRDLRSVTLEAKKGAGRMLRNIRAKAEEYRRRFDLE
jgi:hypothetical protein